LRLRIDSESDLFCLAANLFGNDHLIRFDRSDRTLGEMRRRLGCFRLGTGGWVRVRFGVLLSTGNRRAQGHSECADQSESLKLRVHYGSLIVTTVPSIKPTAD